MVSDSRRREAGCAFRHDRDSSTEADRLILQLTPGVGNINQAVGIPRLSYVSNWRAVDNVRGDVRDSHLHCSRRKYKRGAGRKAD